MSSSPSPDAESRHETEIAENPTAESATEPSAPTDTAETAVAPSADGASPDTASAETEHAESAVVKESGAGRNEPETPSETPRRRLRLQPTADPDELKAVPSLPLGGTPAGTSAQTATTPTTSTDAGGSDDANRRQAVSSATESVPKPVAPVEVPSGDLDLDAEMEAEIAAALSSGELETTVSELPAETAEGDEQPRQLDEEALEEGTRLTGRIESIHGDDVFLDLGFRSPGVVPHRQFEVARKPRVGQLIQVVVGRVDREQGLIQLNLPKGVRRVGGNWDAVAPGQIVDCVVSRSNKGGLEVTIGSLRGFLPAGQVDLYYVSDLEPYIGQKLRVQVLDADEKKRNLVVSRRAYLETERKQAAEELWKTLAEGQVLTGTVKTLKDYGAFVDIGGADGFLHVSQIGWSRIQRPADVLTVGQQVEVKVLSIDTDKQRISLGMRQLIADPWSTAEQDFPKGSTVSGKVTRTTDFGAFVELAEGIEGLVHISELDHARVRKVTDVLKNEQQIEVQVLEVDLERKRISLSLKALSAKPDEPKPDEGRPTEPYQRKRKGPLKGGTSSLSGGGLFGNPGDFGS